jgi:putative membrane protein
MQLLFFLLLLPLSPIKDFYSQKFLIARYFFMKVPYDSLLISYFNFGLNEYMEWTRNNFDRLAHFLYGLSLAYPVRELYCRIANVKGFWSYLIPLNVILATSMLYELFEWGAVEFIGGDLGMAYLGTQGDVWDAQKDMALATIGAVITLTFILFYNLRTQKGFRDEWRLSLQLKNY